MGASRVAPAATLNVKSRTFVIETRALVLLAFFFPQFHPIPL
jgi:hypothetical protein